MVDERACQFCYAFKDQNLLSVYVLCIAFGILFLGIDLQTILLLGLGHRQEAVISCARL